MKGVTYRALQKLEPGKALSDPRCRGLRFIGGPKGIYAQFRYKHPVTGKWRSMGLGRLPDEEELFDTAGDAGRYSYNLNEAVEDFRQRAYVLHQKLRNGIDPRTDEGPEGLPLRYALDRYEEDLKARQVVKVAAVMSLLRRELLDPLGNVPLGKLDRRLLVDRVREVEESGRRGAAKELRTRTGVFLNWATDEGFISANPLAGWRRPRQTRAEQLEQPGRALADDELPALWAAAMAEGPPFGSFVLTLLLTGQRRTETTLMRWKDVDLEQGVWTIPTEITKSGRAQRVPLPALTRCIIRECAPDEPDPDGYVFAGRGGRPMTGWSKRLGSVRDRADLEHWTLHDLRRTVRTGLARLGVEPLVSEVMLNHALSDDLQRTYDRYDYWPERQWAARRWALHVLRQVNAARHAKRA